MKIRTDYWAIELRRLARVSKDVRQSSRLLSLAAVLDRMSRADAARIGGMDRQTLRDWVHRFNEAGPDGLLDSWSSGPVSRLSPSQLTELAEIVETDPERHRRAGHPHVSLPEGPEGCARLGRVAGDDGGWFPIYQQSESHPGTFLVNCRSGVTLAGAHALTLAPMIAQGRLGEELSAFSAGRFDAQAH